MRTVLFAIWLVLVAFSYGALGVAYNEYWPLVLVTSPIVGGIAYLLFTSNGRIIMRV